MYFSDFTSLFSLVAEKAKEEEKEEEEECFEVLTLKIEYFILFIVLPFCINSIVVRGV